MDSSMKSTPNRPRTVLPHDEVLAHVRTLLDSPEDDLQAALMKELLTSLLKLHDSHLDLLDLKIINRAVKELRHAFAVFNSYHDKRKVSI